MISPAGLRFISFVAKILCSAFPVSISLTKLHFSENRLPVRQRYILTGEQGCAENIKHICYFVSRTSLYLNLCILSKQLFNQRQDAKLPGDTQNEPEEAEAGAANRINGIPKPDIETIASVIAGYMSPFSLKARENTDHSVIRHGFHDIGVIPSNQVMISAYTYHPVQYIFRPSLIQRNIKPAQTRRRNLDDYQVPVLPQHRFHTNAACFKYENSVTGENVLKGSDAHSSSALMRRSVSRIVRVMKSDFSFMILL